jgi:glutaredoxin 3
MAKVDIYTTTYCPYCVRAKALLAQKGVVFNEIKVDEHPELRAEMTQRSHGGRTVPQIFIADKAIGGCDELYALEANNQLNVLLQQ